MHECTQSTRIDAIERAMFGDEQLRIKGDHQMIKEMHAIMVGGNIIKKTLVWVFSVTLAIGGAVIMWFEIFKNVGKK